MGSRLRGNDEAGSAARCRISALVIALACGFATTLTHAQSHAQPYPAKPIRLLTAEVGGGSGSDFTARLLAQWLTENLGQQIVVDNRTGGVIIGDIASKAQPDGYTLMLLYSSSLWLMPFMRSHVPYSMNQVIKADADRMGKVIRAANIRAE